MKKLFLKKYKGLFWLVLCLSYSVSAQKMELGKVSIEELRQSQHPLYPDAPAAVLFSKGHSYMRYNRTDGFYLVHEVSMRIKIYRKEGFSYANYEVPFYVGYKELDKDQLRITDAVTYRLVGDKIEKTKAGSEAKIYNQINDKWKSATIVLPNVTEGAVVEFRYEMRSQNLTEFPDFIVQRDIPVDRVEYTTDLPNMYVYKVLRSGFVELVTDASYTKGYQNYEDQYRQTQQISYNELHTVYSAKDVRPLAKEAYVDNLENYRGKISHELESVRVDGEPEKDLSRTWEGVVKRIYKEWEFEKQLKESDYFMYELKYLLEGTNDETIRMNRVFQFVRDRMNWDGKYQYWTDRKLATAYAEKTGKSGEINLILCAMLRMAGVDANPVLLSTVQNGIVAYPNVTAFNHVIVAADVAGKRWLLDAIDRQATPGILPIADLNWSGRLMKSMGDSESVNLQPAQLSRTIVSAAAELAPDGTAKIQVGARRTDYDAYLFRSFSKDVAAEQMVAEKEKRLGGAIVSNYRIENEDKLEEPVHELCEVSTSAGEVIGDRLYIDPLLTIYPIKNPFTNKERQCPVFLGYPSQVKFYASIQIPEGFVVESMPAPAALSTGEGVASFKLTAQQNGKSIQVSMIFETGQMLVSANFYPILQEFYARMTSRLQEKIVLKKA